MKKKHLLWQTDARGHFLFICYWQGRENIQVSCDDNLKQLSLTLGENHTLIPFGPSPSALTDHLGQLCCLSQLLFVWGHSPISALPSFELETNRRVTSCKSHHWYLSTVRYWSTLIINKFRTICAFLKPLSHWESPRKPVLKHTLQTKLTFAGMSAGRLGRPLPWVNPALSLVIEGCQQCLIFYMSAWALCTLSTFLNVDSALTLSSFSRWWRGRWRR